jgi:carotenoid cleavage dioxygenase-like enzyme
MPIIYLCLLCSLCNGFFLNFRFGSPFKIANMERKTKIEYDVPKDDENTIRNISGFYGMIGPNVEIKNVKSLFDLFMGDGIIQGLFFNNGNITFVKKFIRTDKLLYEEKNGRIPTSLFHYVWFMLLHHMGMFPNVFGLANTAFFNTNNNTYALYERDKPYLIDIDKETQTIDTIKKLTTPLNTISGHTKLNGKSNQIATLEYNVIRNQLHHYLLNQAFGIENKYSIHTNYIPIPHDFVLSKNKFISVDSPLLFDGSRLLNSSIPVYFDGDKPTMIHTVSTKNGEQETYTYNKGFYIFHYADVVEDDDTIKILAPVYDNIDYSNLDLQGKYRKIVINKHTKEVGILHNRLLEEYNLEFPVKVNDGRIVMRNVNKNRSDGFVICKDLEITNTFFYEHRNICGEPVVINIENKPHIVCFAYDNDGKSYCLIIDIDANKSIEIELKDKVTIGFHSIFM